MEAHQTKVSLAGVPKRLKALFLALVHTHVNPLEEDFLNLDILEVQRWPGKHSHVLVNRHGHQLQRCTSLRRHNM